MKRALALLCTTALAVSGGAARADNREQARVEFGAGQDADNAHDYLTAIHHYLRAIELVPHPFALYNIAVDYERLGKLRDAATYYQRYVDSSPDSPDRAKMLALLDDLKAKPGRITVRSMPSGARVTIDGESVSPTPFAGSLRAGPHAIAVELAGRREHRDITVEYGELLDVQFDLGGASGTLVVNAAPTGALITVDGSAIGLAPSTLELELGPHRVQISSFGYAAYETTVEIQAGRASEVSPVLVRADGGGGAVGAPSGRSVSFFAGGGGGADVGGAGLLVLGMLGGRFGASEVAAEIGGGPSGFAAAALYRYNLGAARLIPFLGIGYSLGPGGQMTGGSVGGGYQLEAGVRLALRRGEHHRIDLRASANVRYTSDGSSATSFPILLSLEAATQ